MRKIIATGCSSSPLPELPPTPQPTVLQPIPTTPSSHPSSIPQASKGGAELILSVAVKGRGPKTGYSRSAFGSAWADVDGNHCDTRNDILKRDLVNITYRSSGNSCIIQTGVLNDPYTGNIIQFARGVKTSSEVQIDHLFPLSLSWQQGAAAWSAEKRVAFANDPENLRAVQGLANSQKSDSGPGSWLPGNVSYRCTYLTDFVKVTLKYNLSMNPGDFNAAKKILETCP